MFNDLEILNDPNALAHQNTYPVIFLSLKDLKDSSFQDQLNNYQIIIREIISKNDELLTSVYLDDMDKELLRDYKTGTVNKSQLQNGLRFLSICLEKHWHRKVIILIDEYDVPLQSAYLNGYYDEMVGFLRNVFSAALKTNDALEKGVLTGCLRIAKESIFTGLNNFKVNSIFDGEENQQFGFMQNEIDILLQKYDAMEYRDNMKEW